MTTPSEEPRTRRPRRPRREPKPWPDDLTAGQERILVRERLDDLHRGQEDVLDIQEDILEELHRTRPRWSMTQLAGLATLVGAIGTTVVGIISAITGHQVAQPATAAEVPQLEAPTDAASAPEPTP
jgi:hypothetical protein